MGSTPLKWDSIAWIKHHAGVRCETSVTELLNNPHGFRRAYLSEWHGMGVRRMEDKQVRRFGKLEPPAYPFEVVETSLIRRLLDHLSDTKVTLLSAPVGYGKSVLMSAVHRHATSLGFQAYWLNLDVRDTNLKSVTDLLMRALGRIATDPPEESPATAVLNLEPVINFAPVNPMKSMRPFRKHRN